jgi:RNA polymerase sigma-70 factor (ECF subfamily)
VKLSAVAPAEREFGVRSPEAAATERLYERYAARILGYCQKRLGSREEAEDAMQTTFMRAQRGLRRGTVPEFEAAWLYAIAQNVCRTRYDVRRRSLETPHDLDALQDVVAAPERPDAELVAALPDALARMPPEQRRALLLREWQGMSYREIATELATTESAVEALLFRARRSLVANFEQPERNARMSRLGSFAALLKSLLGGGGAAKIAATLVVTATAIAAGGGAGRSPHARAIAGRMGGADRPVRAETRASSRPRPVPLAVDTARTAGGGVTSTVPKAGASPIVPHPSVGAGSSEQPSRSASTPNGEAHPGAPSLPAQSTAPPAREAGPLQLLPPAQVPHVAAPPVTVPPVAVPPVQAPPPVPTPTLPPLVIPAPDTTAPALVPRLP